MSKNSKQIGQQPKIMNREEATHVKITEKYPENPYSKIMALTPQN